MLLVVMTIVMIMFAIGCVCAVIKLLKLNKRYTIENAELKDLRESNKVKVVDYSKQVLDFIRMIVSQVAIIKFRTFIDNNDIQKISKVHIEKLASEVAINVKHSININNISLENTIYTKEFFDEYIIETSILMIKQMFEKTIEEMEEY